MSDAQIQRDDLSTSINELNQGPPQGGQQMAPQQRGSGNGDQMVNNIMDTYQDIELNESEDGNQEEIYQRQMMNDVNEPMAQQMPVQENMQNSQEIQSPPVNKATQKTVMSQIVDSVKAPLIVMVLYFVLSQGFVVSMVESLLIKSLGEESQYSMFGLILRSVIAGVLFYVINFFS